MKKIILALLLAGASLYALEVQNTTVKFTAFKTYAKKGVSGVFDKIRVKTQKADTVTTLLRNATAEIETSSVNSGNKGRDAKLVAQFFNVQDVKRIKAKIIDVTKNTLILQLNMNNKTLNIPMSYSIANNTVNAKGTIDLADFMMLQSLKSINKACYALHQGKTWQDVNIYFTMQYK
ncbi:YceI family protein [Sulfurimonas hydrogeniphila]|uniref:YceI family protein n=1 Tax=Sulfurimonas TaxID=202746 RepID=UPI00125F77B3|nr:YceI family protein [Sulfurimonas hydrogeniphila]